MMNSAKADAEILGSLRSRIRGCNEMGLPMEHGFSLRIDNSRTVWLTEISRRTFDEQDLVELDDDCGLFVVVEDEVAGTFDVLAKVASQSAGLELVRMLVRANTSRPALVSG